MAKLTTKARKRLPASAFVFPTTRKYPINTKKRARSALARVVANGNGPMIHKTRVAVHKRYPTMKVKGL